MRYRSVFVVDYECGSDDEALLIAHQQHSALYDLLRVEGPDEPSGVRLEQLLRDGRNILTFARVKQIDS